MTDEDRLRRALDYEIEPWTPDPAALMQGGRRLAWRRRGAAATAALAVAGTVTGVAVAVNGVTASQPPVSDRPSPSIARVAVSPSTCVYVRAWPSAAVPTAPPTRQVRKPRIVTPPPAHPTSKSRVLVLPRNGRCVLVATIPTTKPGATPRIEDCLRFVPRVTKTPVSPTIPPCRILFVRPRTPVPTSVPAGR